MIRHLHSAPSQGPIDRALSKGGLPGVRMPRVGLALVPALGLALGACATEPIEDIGQVPAPTGVISGEALILLPQANPAPVYLFLAPVTPGEAGPEIGPTLDTVIIPAGEMGPENVTLLGRSGPYTFPAVEPGTYVITGLVDADYNFNLLIPELAVGTADDLAGAYVGNGEGIAVIEVLGGVSLTEINVIFSTPPASATATPTPAPETPTPTPETPTPEITPTPEPETPTPTPAESPGTPTETSTPDETETPAAPSEIPTATEAPETEPPPTPTAQGETPTPGASQTPTPSPTEVSPTPTA